MRQWLLDTEFLTIPIWNWLLAAGAAVIAFLVFVIVFKILANRLGTTARGRSNRSVAVAADMLGHTNWLILALVSLLIGTRLLDLPDRWSGDLSHLWFVLFAIQAGIWLNRAVVLWTERHLEARGHGNLVTATLLSLLIRTVLWATLALAMLDNVGVNITALVASLGIGGVAVALAVQTVLSDLFASISIGLDKPFEHGDFIVVGPIAGNIEHIGLKTTRIRSLGGEQIVCSNTELLKQTIQNYKRMDLRRIVFGFAVSYRTSQQQLERVAADVRARIEQCRDTRFDRAHFARFGDRGLEFEVVYYVLLADYNRYMDIQQSLNLGILEDLERQGVELARPEQLLRITELPEQLPSFRPTHESG